MGNALLAKIRMMPRITLNTYPPTLLGHSEYKGPAFFWVEIRISADKYKLILIKLDILLEIIENLSCMKLFDFGIRPHSCLDYFLLFQLCQTLLNLVDIGLIRRTNLLLTIFLNSQGRHASKEDFKDRFHIVDQHFLKVFFLGI